jgi:sterol desaturase/sphingolipid hydroxylase (fatty acid hydroxylase superfamily)
VWGLPALDWARHEVKIGDGRRQRRHPKHAAFASVNLLLSAAFAGLSAELYHRKAGSLHSSCGPGAETCAVQLVWGVCRSLAVQSVLEFWWHAAMHTPVLYALLHRYHHHYKSPQVWDELFIHPVEAFGYYCLLFSPAVVVRQHYAAFLIYMALCGLFGVLDHSGIRVRLLGGRWGAMYDTRAHDVHHRAGFGPGVYVNLAFPFTLMDVLHRTYVAPEAAGYGHKEEGGKTAHASGAMCATPARRSGRVPGRGSAEG